LYYIKKNNLDIKIHIFSPEFDTKLIKSLATFKYPDEFKDFNHIIQKLVTDSKYRDDNMYIEIFKGDARKYIQTLQNIDIVYQDAFSSDVNHSLWTVEFFKDIYRILNNDAILTTYSIATPIRLSLYESDFSIYEHKPKDSNRITIALNKKEIDKNFKYIDMELKKIRNSTASAMYD